MGEIMEKFIVHVDMGKIGYVIEAESKEEAVKIATQKAVGFVTDGTCSHIHPRVISVDGEEYNAPPLTVRISDAP